MPGRRICNLIEHNPIPIRSYYRIRRSRKRTLPTCCVIISSCIVRTGIVWLWVEVLRLSWSALKIEYKAPTFSLYRFTSSYCVPFVWHNTTHHDGLIPPGGRHGSNQPNNQHYSCCYFGVGWVVVGLLVECVRRVWCNGMSNLNCVDDGYAT